MMDNFNGVFVDTTSVILIINKLELYIDNEDKIINLINDSLEKLNIYYQGVNDSDIEIKKNNLIECLQIILDNKKKTKAYLKDIVEKYIDIDDNVSINFSKGNIN